MKFKLTDFYKKETLILYLIILIGIFLRFQGVFSNSFAFTYDVGRDMLAIFDIANLNKIPLIGATTGLPGVFYGPWWYYMLTPFFIIFSGNPQGIAFVMALVGVITIIAGYFLGKALGGNFLGLSLAVLISVSAILISLSSQIWNPNIVPIFVIFVLLILTKLYKEDKKEKSKYYFLLGLFLSLILDLEIVFGILFFFGILISLVLIKKGQFKPKEIISFVFGVLVISSPRIIFELRHQFLMTKSFIAFFSSGGSGESVIGSVFINRINMFYDQFNLSLVLGNKLVGFIVSFFILFSLVYLYKKSDVVIKKFIKTSIIVIFIFFAGTLFFNHDVWPHYLIGLPVFYVLLFSISLLLWTKKVKNLIPMLFLFAIFILNLNPVLLAQDFGKPLWEGDASTYRNQIAVMDYVYTQANGKSFKYVVYTPGVNDYVYRYLFKWYGPWKYHYAPTVKVTTAYFILEPDYQDPTRLPDWLKKRSGDGIIIKDVTVKGGIRVQTRLVH